jgi:hypothetical protein
MIAAKNIPTLVGRAAVFAAMGVVHAHREHTRQLENGEVS